MDSDICFAYKQYSLQLLSVIEEHGNGLHSIIIMPVIINLCRVLAIFSLVEIKKKFSFHKWSL